LCPKHRCAQSLIAGDPDGAILLSSCIRRGRIRRGCGWAPEWSGLLNGLAAIGAWPCRDAVATSISGAAARDAGRHVLRHRPLFLRGRRATVCSIQLIAWSAWLVVPMLVIWIGNRHFRKWTKRISARRADGAGDRLALGLIRALWT
jgi:hypothetical protein